MSSKDLPLSKLVLLSHGDGEVDYLEIVRPLVNTSVWHVCKGMYVCIYVTHMHTRTHTHTLARSLAHGVNICNIIHGFERGYGNQSSLRTCVNLFMYVYKDILYDYLDTKHNFKSYGILRDRRLSKTVMYLSIIDFIEVLKPM